MKSLGQTISEAIESTMTAIENMESLRDQIRENHMVHLPSGIVEEVNEVETEYNGFLYLVNYRGEVTDPTHGDEKWEIEILSICQSPVEDVNGEYVPLTKIDKETFDHLIQVADKHYFDFILFEDISNYDDSVCLHDPHQF